MAKAQTKTATELILVQSAQEGYLFIYFLSDERTIEIENIEPCQCCGTMIKAAQLARKTTGSIADSTVS